MRNVRFGKGRTDGLKAEVGVEGSGGGLSVEAEGGGALGAGFRNDGVHQVTTETLAAFGGQHTANTKDAGFGIGEEARVSNDKAITTERAVGGDVIDIVEVGIADLLLEIEDIETRLKDFIQVGGRKIRKRLDLQRNTLREDVRLGFAATRELFADDREDVLAGRFVADARRVDVDFSRLVVFLFASRPFGRLLRVGHDDIDDGVHLAKERAVRLLRLGSLGRIRKDGIDVLLAITNAVNDIVFTVEFSVFSGVI